MKILAIDYGSSRTGISLSDITGKIAINSWTIFEKNKKKLLLNIIDLIKLHNIKQLVIGLPKAIDGSISHQGEKIIKFKEEILKINNNIKIILWDERHTTIEANKILNESNLRGVKRKKILDAISANIILQSFLDFNNSKT